MIFLVLTKCCLDTNLIVICIDLEFVTISFKIKSSLTKTIIFTGVFTIDTIKIENHMINGVAI